MTSAGLHAVEEIFHAALHQPRERTGQFLDTACQGDELLRGEVERLLAAHKEAGRFIEIPAVGIATRIIEHEQAALLVGQTIGHYQISQRIGSGGMGEVYLANDLTAGRRAAVKLLPARFTGDGDRLKRFQQEARAVAALNHPNILTVYEIGEYRSGHYIASELVDGETLRQRLARGRMEVSEAVDIAVEIASALAAAHAAGIVHRDIKPENVMVRPDGYVKVLDFGIAKLAESAFAKATADEAREMTLAETNFGSILGTVRYMSPEQARGAPVDQRTDIWSAGVVLYEMVTGHEPFSGDTPRQTMSLILETEPAPLRTHVARCPAKLQQVVGKTLRKNREERYQSAEELFQALQTLRRGMQFKAELRRSGTAPLWLRWTRSPVGAALFFALAGAIVALWIYSRPRAPAQAPAEKSIAVLPFDDLSADQENSYFAAGIQDDLLTSLAEIRDLKVITRTSVMDYQKRGTRNMREISRTLAVANVLEGSVRRIGDRVLINVQLIDARNDQHLWAERYDRTVADSIGLSGELAAQIASVLQAKLAPEEKARLDTRPTNNPQAYVLYVTGLGREAGNRSPEDLIAAEQLYMQAGALDPRFGLAWAQASILENQNVGSNSGRAKPKARALAEEALRVSPALGEAHAALAICLTMDRNYDAALKELEHALASSPNNSEIYVYIAQVYRRQGRWRDAVANFERARSLDPLNDKTAFAAGNNYLFMRDWAAAAARFNSSLEKRPERVLPAVGLAYLELFRNDDPAAGSRILQSIPPGKDPVGSVSSARWDMAMLQRDYAMADKILSETALEEFPQAGDLPKSFYRARVALARGDVASAQSNFAVARPYMEKAMRDAPEDPQSHATLALLYAYMQRKPDALREASRAVEIEPETENAFHGASWAANLALVSALVGEEEQAITLVERLLTTPGAVGSRQDATSNITLAELRLRPEWDSLRNNPRFQKLLAGPEPKTVY